MENDNIDNTSSASAVEGSLLGKVAEAPAVEPIGTVETPVGTVETPVVESSFTMDNLLGTLDDDIKENKSWEKFKSPADLAKSYLELQKMVGHKGDFVGADATPEETQAMWNKLGKPETAEAYGIELPSNLKELEGATEKVNKIAELAHEANLTTDQASKLFAGLFEIEATELDATVLSHEETFHQNQSKLHDAWGSAINEMSQEVVALEQKLGIFDDFESAGLNDNADLLIAFGKLAGELRETSTIDYAISSTPQGVESEISELNAQASEFMSKGQTVPPHIQNKLQELFGKLK